MTFLMGGMIMKKTLNDKGFKGLLFTNTQKEGKKKS